MRNNNGLLRWGVFLLALGAVPLAVEAGLVDRDTVAQVWRLWPLVLVGVGVGLILRNTRIALVGGLVVSITIGLLGGGLLAVGFGDLGSLACGWGTASGPSFGSDGQLGASAGVDLEMNCGDLTARSTAGTGWAVSGVTEAGRAPGVTSSPDRLSIHSRQGDFGLFHGREKWDLSLPASTLIDLSATLNAGQATFTLQSATFGSTSFTVNAGDFHVDLGGSTVSDVSLTLNAGHAGLVLPDTSLTGSVVVNAGAVELCVPSGVGLRITTSENILASYDFGGNGLTKDGSTWTSSNYASATNRIQLSTTANAGSISLNPKDGCR
jgi:hypothetical protein